MSEERRRNRPQVINVDTVIIRANEVIVVDERRHHHRRDPWWFGPRRQFEVENVEVENIDVDNIELDNDNLEAIEEDVEEHKPRRKHRPW